MDIPTYRPIPSGGKVDIYQQSGLKLKLTLRIRLQTPLADAHSPAVKFASRTGIEYFDYELVGTAREVPEDITFKRYRVAFDTVHPVRSKAWATHTLSYTNTDSKRQKFLDDPTLTSHMRYSDGGGVSATLFNTYSAGRWSDPGKHECHLSLRRWTEGPDSKSDTYTAAHPLQPSVSANYLRFASSDKRARFRLVKSSFCPASGKAVTVWRSAESKGPPVTMLDIHTL